MIARVAVSAALYAIDKPYSYRVPEDMPLAAGMRVLVPFGHGNRRTEGIVLSVQEGVAAGLKAVEQMLDDAPILSGGQLRLAALLCKALTVRRIILLVFLPAAARHDQNDQHHEQQQDHK